MSGPDHNDWEDDPVWKLVDEARPPEAGPLFVRNVMREVRLSEEPSPGWWQRLLAPGPILAGSLAAAAAVVIAVVSLTPGREDGPQGPGLADHGTGNGGEQPAAADSQVDELLEEELLFAAAEDPSTFTDEALVDLLY